MEQKLNKLTFRAILFLAVIVHSGNIQLSAQACPGLGSITLNVVAAPQPTLNAPSVLCPGGSGTVSVSQSFNSYSWNVGGSGSSIPINGPGTFTVTVTNAAGCTGTNSVTVNAAPPADPAISQNPYLCNGQVTLNAGPGFSTYAWSNGGGSGSTATYTSAGTYTVTVTNAAGCTGTDNFTVSIPAPPVVNITGTLSFCSNSSTTLNATAGFNQYSWTGGGNGNSISVAAPGTYVVTATDANGCTDTDQVNVSSLPAPSPLVADVSACPGNNATLSISNAPFTVYNWSNAGSGSSISVPAGTYTVTVTAANGCTGTTSANVNVLPAPSPNISENPYTCNGQITLNAGAGFSTYNWSNSTNTPTITVNNNNTFTVTVTNAQGCTGTDSYAVSIPPPPVVNITGDNSFCDGLSANLNATPGFSNYVWSNSFTGSSINITNGGNFTVTATDAFGCTDTDNFTVTELPSPAPVITGTSTICDGLTSVFSTSTPFNSYNWSTNATSASISVGTSGLYTITVTAANGCTGTDSQALTVIPAPAPVVTENPYACNQQLTLVVGGSFSTYNWTGGGSGNSLTVSTGGNYTVTVSNAQGCTGTTTYFADIPPTPSVSISGVNSICPGGSAVLTASPGFNAYVWSDASTNPTLTINSSGNFGVTVTDIYGCTATDAQNVTALSAPAPNISGPLQICENTTATLSVPSSFNTYSWSNGANTPSITVNTTNTYTVTVSAANGCTGTDSQVLNVIPAPNPVITENPYACNQQITLVVGGSFNTYNWSGGASGNSLTVTAGGNYTVTVSNAAGCTGSSTYFADIPVSPAVSISGVNTICPGSTAVLTASPGFNAYVWSDASTNPTLTINGSGNYAVTVTDIFGCTASDGLSVAPLSAPTPSISGPAQICATGAATFSVPGSFTAYNWSTSATTPTITVNTANTYTVTVTAANGCTGTDSQVLTVSTSLQPQIAEAPYACNGQIALDAGAGFSTYNWDGGQSTQTLTVNTNGNYTVTVSDAGGCTGTAAVSVSIPAAPATSITGTNNICAGTNTLLTAGGGLSSYVWSNSQVGNSITVSTAGTYDVTGTDAFGCTASASFTLTTVPAPTPQITGPAVICTNSTATLGVNGSFSQYNWSTSSTSATIQISSGNVYTVTVTDANGCSGSAVLTVTEATALSPVINPLPYACDGQITLNAGPGYAGYSWTGGSGNTTLAVTSSGTYAVTVTDATGCTGATSIDVTVPTVPQVAITGPAAFCQNSSVTLSATPGFVAYAWSTSASSNDISVNQGGSYTVTVTDVLGCTDTETFAVTANPLPQPLINGPTAICAGNTATFTLNNTFSTYAWNDASANAILSTSAAGSYSVTVTDANGCTGSDDISLVVNANPTPAVSAAPYACNGQITLNATPGFSAYNWSIAGNAAQLNVTQSGTYTVTVTDANTCTGTASASATVPALTQVSISGQAQVCNGNNASLSASGGFSNYEWSTAENQINISVNIGTYTVTATDAQGCTSTAAFTVSLFDSPQVFIQGPATVCPGASATLTVTGTYSVYQWNTGETAASITVLPPTSAILTVTDANGCTGVGAISILTSSQITPVISQQPYLCNGQITLDAGAGYSTYAWSNSGNTPTISVTQSGTYTVSVNDGNGCSGSASIQVTVPTVSQVNISGDALLCPGETSTLNATSGFSSYSWSTGATSQSITVNTPGSVSVTATDAQGCTVSTGISLTGLQAPTPQISGANLICNNAAIVLSTGNTFNTYAWSGGSVSNTQNVTIAGTYTVTVSDQNGCSATAQQTVTNGGSVNPVITTQPYLCNGLLNLDAGAGFSTYSWTGVPGNQLLTVNQSGIYSVTVSNAAGCTGSASIQANIPTPPVVNISGATSFCAGSSTTLSAGNGFSAYLWSTGSTLSNAQVSQAGIITVTVTDNLGCTATASVTVQDQGLIPELQNNEVFCQGTSITINVTGIYSSYIWSDGSTQSSLTVGQVGTYTVTVTDASGCTGSATTTIQAVPPASVNITGAAPLCTGNTLTLGVSGSTGTWAWSTGASGASISILQGGTYSVTVTDANGCTAVDTETIVAGPPAETTINRSTCIIQLAGTQVLNLTAANGCDSIVTIVTTYQPSKPGLALDVTSPVNANIGQQVTLDILPNFLVDSVAYQSSIALSCDDCLDPNFTATLSGVVNITAFDADGCPVSSQILINVRQKVNIYVPNVINPGSAQNNILFISSGPEIQSVRNFNVYDRWGNAIFRSDELPTNDLSAGWDGTYRGQRMNPGVYVYYFEIQLPDGSKEIISGDVTVVE
jgi:hypothetical protein